MCRALGDEEDDEDIMMPEGESKEGEEEVAEESKKVSLSDQKLLEERMNMIVAHFLFSIVWTVGAMLDGPSRLKFDEFFKSLCEESSKHPR